MKQHIISLLFIVSPLVICTGLPYPQILPRTILIGLLGAAALGFEFYEAKKIQFTLVECAWLTFFAALITSSLLGGQFAHSLWSTLERGTGLFFFASCAAFYLVLKKDFKAAAPLLTNTITYTLIVMSVFAIAQKLFPGFAQTFSGNRIGGTLGNAIFFGMYLTLNIFLVGLFWEKKHRILQSIAIASGLIALGLAAVTGPVAGFIAGLLITATILLYQKYPRLIIAFSSVVIVIALCGALFLGPNSIKKLPTFQSRLVNWSIGYKNFKAHPIFGTGWESYQAVAAANFDPRLINFGGAETYPDKPHNAYIELLSSTGIVGTILYFCFIAALFWTALYLYRHKKISLLQFAISAGFLTTYLVQNFSAFETHGTLIPLTIFAAWTGARQENKIFSTSPKIILGTSTILFVICYWIGIMSCIPEFIALKNADGAALSQKLSSIYRTEYFSVLNPADVSQVTAVVRNFKPQTAWDDLILAKFLGSAATFHPEFVEVAETAIARAINTNPKRQELFIIKGQLALAQNNLNDATLAFSEAIAIEPRTSQPHYLLGLVLFAQNNNDVGWTEIQLAASHGLKSASRTSLIFIAQKLQAANMQNQLQILETTFTPTE